MQLKFSTAHTFHDKPWEQGQYDCLWPRHILDKGATDAYCIDLAAEHKAKGINADIFRPPGVPTTPTIFSAPDLRDAYEKALLKAGVQIVGFPQDPKPHMRPLGYDALRTLGFGAFLITYRNISNNCPLALWWGDPNAAEGPLSQWYPLFPRKANE